MANLEQTQADIIAECDAVKEMLLEKNRAYGDSALDPVRVFSKASTVEQILVRIDDKLSRLARGSADGEDVERDLLGYLVLLRIARKRCVTLGAHRQQVASKSSAKSAGRCAHRLDGDASACDHCSLFG